MEQDVEYRRSIVERYKKDVEPLFQYLPWLENKKGNRVSSDYTGNDLERSSMAFPVYDATLMNFIKEVQRGSLIDRNYVYVYSRYHLRGPEDELKLIGTVTLKEADILTGILSKYVCEGMTKGKVWPMAVEEGIFLEILLKFKELFALWSKSE